jgi:hypothetical protein
MGSSQVRERRQGRIREGPAERERVAELKRVAARERQRLCRSRKRAEDLREKEELTREARKCVAPLLRSRKRGEEGEVDSKSIRRAVSTIVGTMSKALGAFPSAKARETVLRKVWEHPISNDTLPEEARRLSTVEHSIMSGFVLSLEEVKQPRTAAKLATKHALLTAAVSCGGSGSLRKTARILRVHHRNIAAAIQRRQRMDAADRFSWKLSVRKVRVDVLSSTTKAIVNQWWISETRMSPNRKEVVSKRLQAGVRDEKPAQ